MSSVVPPAILDRMRDGHTGVARHTSSRRPAAARTSSRVTKSIRGFSHLLILAALLVGLAPAAPAAPAQAPSQAGNQASSQAPSQSLGPVRFVSTGAGSKLTVDAVFPPNPNACPANQPHDLTASYPGTLEVGRTSSGGLYLITELTFPEYLKGIAEVPSSWALQALEAQAVAARTYAISHMNSGSRISGLSYDLCSTDACQVYRGLDAETPVWAEAVDHTAGQILEYQGQPIDAFYFSTSNGHTYAAQDVFGGSGVPYLKSVVETDDTQSPTSNWSVRMPLSDLAQILQLAGSWDGRPIDTVAQQGDNIVVSGSGRSTTMSISSFRNRLNNEGTCLTPRRYPTPAAGGGNLPQVVPSVWMTLTQDGPAIVMTGRGWGHGVGMVQWGAKGKADRGLTYQQILAYYYGGLTPVKVPEPGSIRVLLATGVQQVTVTPSGPVHLEGGPATTGTVIIRGGASMTITPAVAPAAPPAAVVPTLALSAVTVTATAMPGKPAGFSFNLNKAASVGITYQVTGATATAQVPAVSLPAGDQTLTWDPFALGLPVGTYTAALVADDGVSRVVSPSFQVTVATPPPPFPSPSPSHLAAAKPAKSPVSLPLLLGAVVLVVLVLAVAAWLVVFKRGGARA